MLFITGALINTLAEPAPFRFVGFLIAFACLFIAAGVVIYRGKQRFLISTLVPFRDGLAGLAGSLGRDEEFDG